MTLRSTLALPSSLDLVRRAAATLLAMAMLAGCGGGVDSGGTGAPVAIASGPITGLGSIVVGGVRFDDDLATIVDQDDNALTPDQLQVGMTTHVDASAVVASSGQATATALTIRAVSEIIGPVNATGPLGRSLTVLGQPVRITVATWFDPAFPAGVASIPVGSVVEVWGQYNARTNEYVATRVAPRAGAVAYELRGVLTAVAPAAQTLTIGGLTISDASIAPSDLPVLSIGRFLRVTLGKTPVNGVWIASSVAPGNRTIPDRSDVRWLGRISSLASTTQFVVNGLPIDASAATFSDGGAGIALGTRVVAFGSTSGGSLRATTVTVLGDETLANSTFELHGTITTLNASAGTFRVRGVQVNYTAQVPISGGAVTDLAPGRIVDVQGTLAANGFSIDASLIVLH